MADLENMLLEAAGRTGKSARKNQSRPTQSKRWRDGSYSDNSDSNDSYNEKYPKKKPSSSQVPLKKRFDPPERDTRGGWGGDDDDQHSGDDSDSLSIGSDLYKNDEDREALQKLPELQREMILTERSMRRDDYRLKKKARAAAGLSKTDQKPRRESPRRESPPPLPSRSRLSARSDRTAAAKSDALNELRAKRMKQQDPEGYRRFKEMHGAGGSLSTGGDSPPKHRATSTAESSDSDSVGSESGGQSDGEEDGFTRDTKLADNLDDDGSPSSLTLKFEDVKEITIRRRKLVKWFMEPFFEDIIVGCFVRVGIGTTRSGKARYRLCIVRNVDASEPDRQYKLETYTTHKYLNCVWGSESSAARWQMARISDSEPTEEEFNDWVQEVERTGGRMPSRQEVKDKKEAIQKINSFVYSAATVKQMLQEKKSASSRPINIAAEKDRLRKEMEVAESRHDEAEVKRIRARVKELEEMSRLTKQIDAKAVRLAEMNRRNRAENFRNASELKPVNTSLKAGEAGYDPFSRRWTRSRNYYISKPGGDGNGAAANGDAISAAVGNGVANGMATVNGVEAAGVAATAAALEAAADAGKLVDTSAPVDQGTESNSLHDFELPISLAVLQKFGGPQGAHLGFMARKQRMEATIGYKVPDNDGRRHALTLTVSDYKRRRGLL